MKLVLRSLRLKIVDTNSNIFNKRCGAYDMHASEFILIVILFYVSKQVRCFREIWQLIHTLGVCVILELENCLGYEKNSHIVWWRILLTDFTAQIKWFMYVDKCKILKKVIIIVVQSVQFLFSMEEKILKTLWYFLWKFLPLLESPIVLSLVKITTTVET